MDIAEFQKDMGSLECQHDMYFVLLASLLNISVLKQIRPLIARRGLEVGMGGSCTGVGICFCQHTLYSSAAIETLIIVISYPGINFKAPFKGHTN